MLRRTLLALVLVTLTATMAAAQTTYLIVRHAERADGPGSSGGATDPSLSAAGRARAASLAAILKNQKLSAVFATEFKRTQQTAAPTAKAQGLTVTTIPAGATPTLVEKLKGATGAVLVVGHSNTVPEIVAGLGIATPVTIDDQDFDNLFIVTTGEHSSLVRLRYK